MNTKKSKTALALTAIYLLFVLAAFTVMFMAKQDESLAGVFVVIVAIPWTMLLMWFTDTLGIDSITFNTVFLAVGSIFNAVIIYFLVSIITRLFRRST